MDTDSNRKFSGIKGWFLIILGALLLAFVTAIYYQYLDGPRPVLRFEYRASDQVLTRWDFDQGEGWNQSERVRWVLVASDQFLSEEVMVPQGAVKKMKVNFDPIDGEIEFRNFQLIHAGDSENIEKIPMDSMRPVSDTNAYEEQEDGYLIRMAGEKVPSMGWSTKSFKDAWKFGLFQDPFGLRFLRGTLFFSFCGLAIWGPICRRGGTNRINRIKYG